MTDYSEVIECGDGLDFPDEFVYIRRATKEEIEEVGSDGYVICHADGERYAITTTIGAAYREIYTAGMEVVTLH